MEYVKIAEDYIASKRGHIVDSGFSLEQALQELNYQAVLGMGMKDERGILWPSEIQITVTKGIIDPNDFWNILYPSNILVELLIFATQADKNEYIRLRDNLHSLIKQSFKNERNN